MTTKLVSSSRLHAVIGLATVALLVAGLLSWRVMAYQRLQSSSAMQMSTANEHPSNFVASGGLVADSDPAVPGMAEALATPMRALCFP